MNAVLKATDWYQQLLQTNADSASSFEQMPLTRQARAEARETFQRQGFPDRKQEAWRYSNIQSLLAHTFAPLKPDENAVRKEDVSQNFIAGLDAHRLVFLDNNFRADLSTLNDLPDGVVVQSLSQAMQTSVDQMQQWFGRAADHKQNSFIALNTALMSDGLFIHVHNDVSVDKPIEVVYLISSRDEPVTSTPRVLVVLAAGAKAMLIERFVGTGHSFSSHNLYFNNMVEEIILHDSASLDHYRLLEEQDHAYHLSNIDVRQETNSHYQAMNLDLSGAWLRSNYTVDFRGTDAACQLHGLYIVDGKRHSNMHTNILHHAPSCSSAQNFKGLLLGAGRAVFDGRILVDKQAQLTDAHLSNSNLMLSEEAEVDTKPQLEIYADNVKCSHGTTVGQLEPEQLFYLRSRGIAEADAYRMLCQGFVSEILESCNIEAVREHADVRIQQSLSAEKQI